MTIHSNSEIDVSDGTSSEHSCPPAYNSVVHAETVGHGDAKTFRNESTFVDTKDGDRVVTIEQTLENSGDQNAQNLSPQGAAPQQSDAENTAQQKPGLCGWIFAGILAILMINFMMAPIILMILNVVVLGDAKNGSPLSHPVLSYNYFTTAYSFVMIMTVFTYFERKPDIYLKVLTLAYLPIAIASVVASAETSTCGKVDGVSRLACRTVSAVEAISMFHALQVTIMSLIICGAENREKASDESAGV